MALDKNGDLGGRDGVDDGSSERAPSSSRIHPVLRTLGAGSAAFALAAGIMAGSMADVPWNEFTEHPAFAAPVEPEPVVVGVIGASSPTGPRTVGEVLDVIERAELAAIEAGRSLDPEVQQAAAELGSLLTIYVAQQEASLAPRPGLGDHRDDVVEEAPDPGTAGAPEDDVEEIVDTDGLGDEDLRPPAQADPAEDPDQADAGSVRPQDQSELGAPEIEYQDPADDGGEDGDGAAGDEDGDGPRATADLEPVEPVEVPSLELPTLDELLADDGTLPVARPYEHDASTGGPDEPAADDLVADDSAVDDPAVDHPAADERGEDAPTADADSPVAAEGEEHGHAHAAVTFDDVVVAATRLATLLDPASATYVVDVRPAVTELEDGTFVLSDGTPVTADGQPLDAATASLSAALRAVVDQHAGSTAGYGNGRIPASVLCDVPWAPGHMLRCDAAVQFEKLNEAYRDRFGTNIPLTDSYRSYDSQVAVRAAKPHLAAVPGTSNHGWGLAVDLSHPISGGTSAEYAWLRVHGPDYGWDNPTWARPDGRKPEPWHFEFFAAGPVPDRATSTADFETSGSSSDGNGSSGGGQDEATPADTKKADGKKDEKSDGKKTDKKSDGKKTDKKSDGKKTDKKSDGKKDGTNDDGGSKTPGNGGKKPSPEPAPSKTPTPSPPTADPTDEPSEEPTTDPTDEPSEEPTTDPTDEPSEEPTTDPTDEPSEEPTTDPTEELTEDPTPSPSPSTSSEPTDDPSKDPEDDEAERSIVNRLLGLDDAKEEDPEDPDGEPADGK
ncbi:D-alanyl-D-alanine carboxypeptidase family protein [Isoptericola halotolerans]|uniref:D-alanyl-D-alanine carboxypeptidase family protein n=1 Tax=Isoptericola halotolerans TaxID=300560 RepID=UPI00388D56AE